METNTFEATRCSAPNYWVTGWLKNNTLTWVNRNPYCCLYVITHQFYVFFVASDTVRYGMVFYTCIFRTNFIVFVQQTNKNQRERKFRNDRNISNLFIKWNYRQSQCIVYCTHKFETYFLSFSLTLSLSLAYIWLSLTQPFIVQVSAI